MRTPQHEPPNSHGTPLVPTSRESVGFFYGLAARRRPLLQSKGGQPIALLHRSMSSSHESDNPVNTLDTPRLQILVQDGLRVLSDQHQGGFTLREMHDWVEGRAGKSLSDWDRSNISETLARLNQPEIPSCSGYPAGWRSSR